MKSIIIFTTLAMLLHPVLARQITISGNDPDYVGRVITFHSFDNYFSEGEIKIGECTVDANGNFSVIFTVSDVRLIFTRLGVFNARLFVQPGFSYEVKLPPCINKSPEDEENPFFEESSVYMNLLSVKGSKGENIVLKDELNIKIMEFYQTFAPISDNLTVDAFYKRPVAPLDSTIANFIAKLPRSGDSYFDNYAFYRSGLLYFAAQRGGVRHVSHEYFANKPVLYYNHAYMELFNTTYDNYFRRANDDIFNVINRQRSFNGLKYLLAQDGVLPNDSLCELVILKNLHDEFYADRFSRAALLNILDSAIVHSKIERHSEIAGEIRSKITKLLRGFEPPDFELYKHDSTLISLQNYKGKYVYLMFCTTYSYICLGQYKLLEELYQKHHKWLDIVVISADDNFANMIDFRQKSDYQWDFLHFGNDPEVIKRYDVRIFPTSYLIGPDGKLTLSPAPAPMPVYLPEYFDEGAPSELERVLWEELNSKGLWHQYLEKGLIDLR